MSGPTPTYAAPTYDVIVVLGGPMPAMRRRTAHGVRLLQAGRAERILMSGGGRKGTLEAEVMAGLARAAGVPRDKIVLEGRSRSTMDNARFSARVMAAQGWRTALVVTDLLHLPRALLAFRSAGVRARGSAVTSGWREQPLRAWCGYAVYEAAAFVWYVARILTGRLRRRGHD